MCNKFFFLIILLSLSLTMFASDFEWGIKYGAGVSQIHGSNLNYNLHYDFTKMDINNQIVDGGYFEVTSNKQKHGLSHNAGIFFTYPLTADRNELLFQPEILWQRYTYSYWFKDCYPVTNNYGLTWPIWGKVNGTVESRLDYVSVPLLIKMQQDKPEDTKDNHAIVSMFGYIGPSISYLFDNKTTNRKGIKTLDNAVETLIANTLTDADIHQYYEYTKALVSADKLIKIKYDLVFGFGWNIIDALKAGCGTDEWVIDFRFNLNVNPLGDSVTGNNFKLYNGLASIGYKF
ncbi:MAG: outer membrane beta-barrel protein [Candidatus Cloacimonetes bacterium]|nr:outer membrane beta-barrel protein [Candidatus Cloacimonadota bacterium]